MKSNTPVRRTLGRAIIALLCLLPAFALASPGNGKVEFRTPNGGPVRVEIRISDPDGVGPYWIFGGANAAGPLESAAGATGDCAKEVVITLAGANHLNHAHYVVYNDCQDVPAAEAWKSTGYFTEWTEGERDNSLFGSGSATKQVGLLQQIRTLVIVAIVLLAVALLLLLRRGSAPRAEAPRETNR